MKLIVSTFLVYKVKKCLLKSGKVTSLHKLIHHNSLLIAPPVIMEQYYWSLIDGMPFRIGDQKMEYVSYFSSYEKLNEYCMLIQE